MVPVKVERRLAFSIAWYATLAEADAAARVVRQRDDRYYGGFFHGMPCGRARSFDGAKVYAVTFRGQAPESTQ
jgi:hypothetical protein